MFIHNNWFYYLRHQLLEHLILRAVNRANVFYLRHQLLEHLILRAVDRANVFYLRYQLQEHLILRAVSRANVFYLQHKLLEHLFLKTSRPDKCLLPSPPTTGVGDFINIMKAFIFIKLLNSMDTQKHGNKEKLSM